MAPSLALSPLLPGLEGGPACRLHGYSVGIGSRGVVEAIIVVGTLPPTIVVSFAGLLVLAPGTTFVPGATTFSCSTVAVVAPLLVQLFPDTIQLLIESVPVYSLNLFLVLFFTKPCA